MQPTDGTSFTLSPMDVSNSSNLSMPFRSLDEEQMDCSAYSPLTPPDSENATIHLRQQWICDNYILYMGTSIFFTVLCAVAILVNVVTLLSVFFLKKYKSIVVISFSLVASDTMTLFWYGLSFIIFTFFPNMEVFKDNSCIALAIEALKNGGYFTSLAHLAFIALYHYRGSLEKLEYMINPVRKKNLYLSMVILWTFPNLLICLHIYYPGTCAQGDRLSSLQFRLTYIILFFAALALMMFIYTRIYFKLKNNREKTTVGKQAESQRRSRRGRKDLEKKESAKKYFYITYHYLIFLVICWAPAFLRSLLICDIECLVRNTPNIAFASSIPVHLLLIFKNFSNSYLYAIRSPEIKSALKVMWQRICCGCAADNVDRGLSSHNSFTRTLSRTSHQDYRCRYNCREYQSTRRPQSTARRATTRETIGYPGITKGNFHHRVN